MAKVIKSKEITLTSANNTKIVYELLDCGHANNLALKNRESGKCPKGCDKV